MGINRSADDSGDRQLATWKYTAEDDYESPEALKMVQGYGFGARYTQDATHIGD